MNDEALKLPDEQPEQQSLIPEEEINIEELRELNRTIISEGQRLMNRATRWGKRTSKGDKIPKEDVLQQAEDWKILRELEKSYSFMLKKAKQKGIKQKDIEADDDATPDIESIKKQKGTIGAIVRKMG